MRSFVDESVHSVAGIYVVGAALISPERVDDLRLDVRGLLLKRQRRFHWRDEGEVQRQRMIRWIAGSVGLEVCAYIVNPFEPKRQERARAQCLKMLLWELKERGSTHLVVESRGDHYDKQDRRVIVGLQKSGGASEKLEHGFSRPLDEPLLWIADAVSSCVASYVRDGSYGEGVDSWPLESTIL